MPHWRLLTSSDHLRAIDLQGRSHVVTIVRVTQGNFRGEPKKGERTKPKRLPDLHFKEFEVPYGSCPTNSKMITKLLGSENTDDWIGRCIEIYPTEVDAFGEIKLAIRVKPTLPKQDPGPRRGQQRAPQRPAAPEKPPLAQGTQSAGPPAAARDEPPPYYPPDEDEQAEIAKLDRENS